MEKGKIENVKVYSDSIDLSDVDHLTNLLKGASFSRKGLEDRFDTSD